MANWSFPAVFPVFFYVQENIYKVLFLFICRISDEFGYEVHILETRQGLHLFILFAFAKT